MAWGEERSQFTALFECLAIDVMMASGMLRISWDEAWPIMEQAVERGLKAKKKQPPKQIGVDEKTAGWGHDYLNVVCDLERATVEYVADDGKKESVDGYFALISKRVRERIEAIVLDIWDQFLASIREHVPES